jgi:hypothetical protein
MKQNWQTKKYRLMGSGNYRRHRICIIGFPNSEVAILIARKATVVQ